jgi:predicted nuclease with RNAse H fold
MTLAVPFMSSPDEIHFGMKKLSPGNWREPDIPKSFPDISEEAWVSRILEPKLIDTVPSEIVRMFEVARGSIIYGWFFYPLLTLATEQLYRVQESAARARCKTAGISVHQLQNGKRREKNFVTLIRDLSQAGIIPADAASQWETVRTLRNWSSHPEHQMINVPGAAIATVEVCARRINQLYSANPDYHSMWGTKVRRATGLDRVGYEFPVVVGIDVGASKKGFHLVAFRSAAVLDTAAIGSPSEVVGWCKDHNAKLVAVDAPCGWSQSGENRSREAERILAQMGYSAHATPTRDLAKENPFYSWMFNGEKLYEALEVEYPLYRHQSNLPPQLCFETYPYAAACALVGQKLVAADKEQDRRRIFRAAGVDDGPLTNIDFVDAAICALVAYCMHANYCAVIGNAEEGFMVCPPLL